MHSHGAEVSENQEELTEKSLRVLTHGRGRQAVTTMEKNKASPPKAVTTLLLDAKPRIPIQNPCL